MWNEEKNQREFKMAGASEAATLDAVTVLLI